MNDISDEVLHKNQECQFNRGTGEAPCPNPPTRLHDIGADGLALCKEPAEQFHHLDYVSKSGLNVVALCTPCHTSTHRSIKKVVERTQNE